MDDLTGWFLAAVIYAVFVTTFLIIAVGGNADLARQNRRLRATNLHLELRAAAKPKNNQRRRPIVAAVREDRR